MLNKNNIGIAPLFGSKVLLYVFVLFCLFIPQFSPIICTGSRGVAQPGKDTPDPATVFSVKLSSLVISAVRTTLAPSVPGPPGPGDTSEIVMVPLIFFRGSFGGNIPEVEDPLTLNGLLDIPQVSKAVNAMALPEQEVVVVGATHYFSEHPQVHQVSL